MVKQANRRVAQVLHIGKYYPPHMGGMETHVHDLVVHQSGSMMVNVLVASESIWTRTETLDGATVTRVGTFGTIASVPVCPTLALELYGRKDSIVHLHLPNPGAALALLLSGHQGTLVVTHHSDTVGRASLRQASDPVVKRVMERASVIVVTSRRYLDSSSELEPFRDKCRVIPIGIDPARFQLERQSEVISIRRDYGARLVLAVGRLVPYKGFEYLIRSMRDVDATLLLIGTGPLLAKLTALVRTCGLSQKVHLLGYVEDTAPYYKAADLFVLPSISRAEAFGIVQLEAMASGRPVVNTDIDSGVPEVSVHHETGLTVAPKSSEELSNAINLLLNNAEMSMRYGHAAAQKVAREFSVGAMAANTIRIYESAVG